MKIIGYIVFSLFILSCNEKSKRDCKTYTVQDYIVDIKFSSFFDCGEFKRIILNNKGYGFSPEYTFCKEYTLYTVNTKERCKQLLSDTLSKKLTIIQSDSLFDLTNKFINNYTLENHINVCDKKKTNLVVKDGANIEVILCLENKCISASYYHYANLKDISEDLNNLIEYVNFCTNGK